MPAYEYAFEECGKDFTACLSVKDYGKVPVKRAHCGSEKVRRKISGLFAQTSRKS
ncbi:MAG: hypothetical protein Kow0025_05580 [Thermodesulfovibrionales bacterium]